jgi:hypothetical protein
MVRYATPDLGKITINKITETIGKVWTYYQLDKFTNFGNCTKVM